jgi:hypothetical protein
MRILSVLFTLSLSMAALAGAKYTCEPFANNSYFTDNATLEVLSASSIVVNGTRLNIDKSYDPRTMLGFERFLGDTNKATKWIDSGNVEVLLKPETKRLVFQVRGDDFIKESFSCK